MPIWAFESFVVLRLNETGDHYAAMAEKYTDQEFLEYVVKAIVNHPEDVRVERIVDDQGILLTIHINQDDMGYVIGQRGATAQALRRLLNAVGAKANVKVSMKIWEPDEARREHMNRKQGANGNMTPAAKHGDAGLVTDQDLADLGI